MASSFTLNLTIIGIGQVDVSGYGIYGGSPTGGSITYAITLPILTQILLVRMYIEGCEAHEWSGDFVEVPTIPILNIYELESGTVNITIHFYCSPVPVIGGGSCCDTTSVPAAPPEPTSESVRIASLQRCVAQQALPPGFVNCAPCRTTTERGQRRYTTVGERDRLLREISRCHFYARNQQTGGICPGNRVEQHDTTRNQSISAGAPDLETTRPYTIHQYRTVSRIRGIEDLARPVRGPAAGEYTARRRAAIEAAAANAVRHGEHFRTLPPPPPCAPPNTLPQPGVPHRLQPTPCIPGQQRVDYSNPIAK
jgi:hypothetical protein